MNEIKCKECGAALALGTKECPACGCPVEGRAEYVAPAQPQTKKKFNVMSIFSFLIGVVIVIMGITVMNKDVNIYTYYANPYNADYAAFGGDFYTEIYGVCDIIVDELDDINGGIEALSKSMETMANVIYYPIGMMIIALGLGVLAISFIHIKE